MSRYKIVTSALRRAKALSVEALREGKTPAQFAEENKDLLYEVIAEIQFQRAVNNKETLWN
jgi:DNA-directed RNA polymerase subunit K/omega